jgi:hypothetical protein
MQLTVRETFKEIRARAGFDVQADADAGFETQMQGILAATDAINRDTTEQTVVCDALMKQARDRV